MLPRNLVPFTPPNPPPAKLSPILVNTREAARLLDVHPNTIRGLADQHRLKPVRIGRAVRFDIEDLKQLIARSK